MMVPNWMARILGKVNESYLSGEPAISPENKLRCTPQQTYISPKLSYNKVGWSLLYMKSRAHGVDWKDWNASQNSKRFCSAIQ
jgi:hypothetical protein